MLKYDVLLIHPPAIYDFRETPIFPGAMGSTVEQIQFIKVPIGMLSIAEYLDRYQYKVLIDNIGERMVTSEAFNVENHIRETSARVYAIGLHWQQHSQGAIEIARICKKLHPDSLVVLGGLTATCFHTEIMQKYEFIDAVIRGEAEKPFLEFIKAINQYGKITDTPNLTYRTGTGEIRVIQLMKPSENLDEFEFTRFDLVEPKTSIFSLNGDPPRGFLIICRGCVNRCITCGGSSYTYKKYLGMGKPAFRSPGKIIDDIKKLNKQGIRIINLFQDPRMGGKRYYQELFSLLSDEKIYIDWLTFDIFSPVNEEFAKELASIGKQITLYFCPESGSCAVRKAQGRCYTNEEIVNTVKLCHRYHISVQTFFTAGLAGESHDTMKDTWELWEKLSSLDRIAISKGILGNPNHNSPVAGPIIGPEIIDPGSLAYDFSERYGYKLAFKNIEGYIDALSKPSWHQWLNFETDQLDTDSLVELMFESIEYAINEREKYGLYNNYEAAVRRLRLKADRVILNEAKNIMIIEDVLERESRLKNLRINLNSFLVSSIQIDSSNYVEMVKKYCLINQTVNT
jgi:B12-binding domain/radical SAM domain protein